MSYFTMVLLEEGVDVEIDSDLSELISLLDQEVPQFACEGRGYALTAGRGSLGSQWDLMVRSVDPNRSVADTPPLGRVELTRLDDGMIQLKIPPRSEQASDEIIETDPDGRFYGSFIYQTLNVLNRHKFIDLPGELPTA